MSKNKHLNLDDRCKIQLMLDNKESFSSIATALERSNYYFKGDPQPPSVPRRRIGGYHLPYNNCARRISCLK